MAKCDLCKRKFKTDFGLSIHRTSCLKKQAQPKADPKPKVQPVSGMRVEFSLPPTGLAAMAEALQQAGVDSFRVFVL